MATVTQRRRPPGTAVVLHGVDWRTYSQLCRIFADRSGVRMTYDRGALEIMSPLFQHENDGGVLGRFVEVLSEELNIPILTAGSTTFRRKKKQRGLEADKSWWIQNEPRVRGKRKIDLRVDPPPDLAIEVDVTSSSLDKMDIYAALGVPEVWRGDDSGLAFEVLQASGQYASVSHSRAFPLVTPADLSQFLAMRATLDETRLVKEFRAWVRQQLAGGAPTGPP